MEQGETMMILAEKTCSRGTALTGAMETERAEALFASTLQPSDEPSLNQISRAVETTLHQLGKVGCAARLASEFGDHPDRAPARMLWALAMIRAIQAPCL
jgi:hypothetical protein